MLFLISEDGVEWTNGRIWLARSMGTFHKDRKENRINGQDIGSDYVVGVMEIS